MSISQAVASYHAPFPLFATEEPDPRPGNGPAFSAAMSRDQPAHPGTSHADGTSSPPASVDRTETEGSDDAMQGADPATADDPVGTENGPTAADAAPSVAEEARDNAEPLSTPFAFAALPSLRPPTVPVEPDSAEATPISAGPAQTRPDPEVGAPAATLVVAAETKETDIPIVVSASQLPFVQVGGGSSGRPVALGEAVRATTPIDAMLPSPSAQTSLALAGFGQSLSALRASGGFGRAEATAISSDQDPQPAGLPRLTVQAHPTAVPMPQETVLSLASAIEDPAAGLVDADALPLGDSADVSPFAAGTSAASTAAPSSSAGSPTAVTPSQLAPLIVSASREGGATNITITLAPEELGTLHMRVSLEGEALRVTMLAERQETLDLMRRYGDQLLSDLRDLGFGGASLGFGKSSGGAAEQQPASGSSSENQQNGLVPPQPSPAPSRTARPGGLDIRL